MTALNGEPEGSVSVEAVGQGPSHCAEYQEDATTEGNGQFRIRGLLPGVSQLCITFLPLMVMNLNLKM